MVFHEPEGATPLDADEIDGLKFPHITTRGQLNELEQSNIVEGMAWLARRRSGDILTDKFIRKLHIKLFGEVWDWAGSFRLTERNIGIDPRQIVEQLPMLLGDARYWAENKTFSPLEAAARFHHRLVQIHPFPNGNGRHGRIAADVFLKAYYDHPPVEWASGTNIQADSERRNMYIQALQSADNHNFGPLLAFVGA